MRAISGKANRRTSTAQWTREIHPGRGGLLAETLQKQQSEERGTSSELKLALNSYSKHFFGAVLESAGARDRLDSPVPLHLDL